MGLFPKILLTLLGLTTVALHSIRIYIYLSVSTFARTSLRFYRYHHLPQALPLSGAALSTLLVAAAASAASTILLLPFSFPFTLSTHTTLLAHRPRLARTLQIVTVLIVALEVALACIAFHVFASAEVQGRFFSLKDHKGAAELAHTMQTCRDGLVNGAIAAGAFFVWSVVGLFAAPKAEEQGKPQEDIELDAVRPRHATQGERWDSVDLKDDTRTMHYVFTNDTRQSEVGHLSRQ